MPREFRAFLSRLGARNVAAMSGVSLNTIKAIASGRILAGPIVRVRLKNAIDVYKMNILMDAGASEATAFAAKGLSFGQIERYASRLEQIITNIVRDRSIPGEGYTQREYRAMILEGLARSEKSIPMMYEKYVA